MPQAEHRTVTLSPDQARYVDRLVASGAYGSANAVVRAALQALQARDAAITRWVRQEVVPILSAFHPDSEWTMPEEQLVSVLRQQQAVRQREYAEHGD